MGVVIGYKAHPYTVIERLVRYGPEKLRRLVARLHSHRLSARMHPSQSDIVGVTRKPSSTKKAAPKICRQLKNLVTVSFLFRCIDYAVLEIAVIRRDLHVRYT